MAQLTIPENIYSRILTVMGYPIVREEDLGLTADQIKDLLILPPVQSVYFAYFPRVNEASYTVSSRFSIPFPTENTFAVRDARINTRPYHGGGKVANPLINELNIRVRSGGGMGMNMWDTENDYGYSSVRIYESLERQAYIESDRATKIYVNTQDRTVEGYTNTYGDLAVDWAEYSTDWSAVRHQHQEEVIKLAQAYVADYFGNLWNMGNANVPNELDGGELLSKAEDLRTEVMEKWAARAKPVLLR
jgi:hypothetical protein